MKRLVIYVPGKGGNAKEALHYQSLFQDCDVIGLDYQAQNPWEAKAEFSHFFDLYSNGYDSVMLVANSIGAFLSMSSLEEKAIEKAFFISPIVNMEKLIMDMLSWSNTTEEALRTKKEITTDFQETLSWDYLCYVREHPIEWPVPTHILYGEKDHLTSFETISQFCQQIGAQLTVMENGEHWFHTEKQLRFLDDWINKLI